MFKFSCSSRDLSIVIGRFSYNVSNVLQVKKKGHNECKPFSEICLINFQDSNYLRSVHIYL